MPKYIKPLNAAALKSISSQLEAQYQRMLPKASTDQHLFLRNCMLVYANENGKCPSDRCIQRWLAANHSPIAWNMWPYVLKLLTYHGYDAAYPLRLGGRYSTPETHPVRWFPAQFDLDLSQAQLKWLEDHDWTVVPMRIAKGGSRLNGS